MLQIEKKLETAPDINWELFSPKERIVFLDIETTGFRASSSSLYLVGLAEYCGDAWKMHQFFAEKKSDELRLIQTLGSFFREKKRGKDHLILITYNGDGFDIPYLKEVGREYGETGLFRDIVSFDLYKEIKPFRKAAGLENLRLKTVEKKCGICREDLFSGGDLISVYEEFLRLDTVLKDGSEGNGLNRALKKKCLDSLLLHNAEDIADLIPTMRMMGYRYLKEGNFDFESAGLMNVQDRKILDLRFRLKEKLPSEFRSEDGHKTISVSGEDPYLMEITSEILQEELRFYYPDYKDYYYLPAEDMAVHKSVAQFTERKNRTKASASNCYTKERGEFFEVFPGAVKLSPFFYRTYKGRPCARFSENLLADGEIWKEYALAAIHSFLLFP